MDCVAVAPGSLSGFNMFEVGAVYSKNSRLYVAVSEYKLITFIKRRCKIVKPYRPIAFHVIRDISVEGLCDRWDISTDSLDRISATLLVPSPDGIKGQAGGRIARKKDTDFWRALRSVAIRDQ